MATPKFAPKNQWNDLPSLFITITAFLCCWPSSQAKISYQQHCGNVVPQTVFTGFAPDTSTNIYVSDGYFSGGEKIWAHASSSPNNAMRPGGFSFSSRDVYRTQTPEIFHLTGYLNFQGEGTGNGEIMSLHPISTRHRRRLYYYYSSTIVNFNMAGFWSRSTGKLCMVGSGSTNLKLSAVFNLNYPNTTDIKSSVVKGNVQIFDSSDSQSDTISAFVYPLTNYKYTLIPNVNRLFYNIKAQTDVRDFQASDASSYLQRLLPGQYKLEYGRDCSAVNCGPFSYKKAPEFLPTVMTLNMIQTTEDGKVHMYIVFANSSSSTRHYNSFLIPGKSLVSEGYWDSEKKLLCLLACPVFAEEDSTSGSSVGECTIGLRFWFPSVYTLKERSTVAGHMWSVGGKNAPDYFSTIFRSFGGYDSISHGMNYKYANIPDTVRRACVQSNISKLGKYPDENSLEDLRFQLSLKDIATGNAMWGDAYPMSFGETFLGHAHSRINSGISFADENQNTRKTIWDVSYEMSYRFYNSTLTADSVTDIAAEGIYNARAGTLCMVGCKAVETQKKGKAEDTTDCQIEINIQLSPLYSHNGADIRGNASGINSYVTGTIRSTRERSDPLYFDTLNISSHNMYASEATATAVRMDMEITMVLISLTVSCIIIILQIFHVRKHKDVLASISITMLVILTLGYMIPLVMNFEALFGASGRGKNIMLWSGGWLQVNEVIVRIMTMVAFLLQCRLLQFAWTARSSNEDRNGIWSAERKALQFCIPVYFAGALLAWFMHTRSQENQGERLDFYSGNQHSMWIDLISYVGLILDGFLLPQIILNIMRNSKEKALAPLFYIGTTAVRILPHLYDAYRASNFVSYFNFSYIYASPDIDYFSTGWDIVITLGGVLFAVLLCLQQRLGGRCFIPPRFRKPIGVETVPFISL